MKQQRIFCIGCNYSDHNRELRSVESKSCVVFMKPTTSIVPVGTPVEVPRDRGEVHHEVELVLVIGREGKNIKEEDALNYIEAVTLGVDLTLRDIQSELLKNAHPWELCKSFDNSAPLGEYVPYVSPLDLASIELKCSVNGELKQSGNTCDMLHSAAALVSIVSRTWRLLPGDLIFTGTPAGVGPVSPGDTLSVESSRLGKYSWNIV